MLTSGINFINFKKKIISSKIKKKFNLIIRNQNQIVSSLGKDYKNSYKKEKLKKYKNFSNYTCWESKNL